jgi:Zn-dependent protease
MLPVWQLDGAWVLAPVSPWFQVAGLVAIAVLALVFHFVSVLLVIIAVLGIQSARAAFRNARNPYYSSVPANARIVLFAAWLALVVYLGVMTLQAESLFTSLAR